MHELREHLRRELAGRTCLIGLGNRDYGDDGVGATLAEELMRAGVADVLVAGTEPDRFVARVANEGYDRVVFLDAVDFGGTPGSVALLDAAEIASRYPQISTHKISLGVLGRWIEAGGKTKVSLLGVQPESVKPGNELSATVRATVDVLRGLLLEVRLRSMSVTRDAGASARRDSEQAEVTV